MKNKLRAGIPVLVAAVILLVILNRSDGPSGSTVRGQADSPVETAVLSPVPDPQSASLHAPDAVATGRTLVSAHVDGDVVWKSKNPAAFRARAIEPDAALLAKEPVFKVGDRLTLPFFDDAVLDAEIRDVTSYPNGAVGMTARLEGEYSGTVYLSSCGGELRIHAEVLGGNDFYVRYDPEQHTHIAIEMDRENSDYLEDCFTCIGTSDTPAGPQADSGISEDEDVVPSSSVTAFDGTNDSVVVNVMIVYTPAALAWEGSTNAINNNIALAMQKANEAHGNSDTKVTLNLVYSGETPYIESGNPSTDLNALRDEGDGAMDDVHTLRNTYEADMVCLLEDEPDTGGIAGLMDDADGQPEIAFCLARVQQTSWTYTVVHEWGHNMGCGHSSTQIIQPGPGVIYSYSAGWQWSDAKADENWPYTQIGYCSVMTYEDFDSAGDQEYERVAHFSNPDIYYVGDSTNATGNAATGDNARAIRNVRYVVSEFRFPVMTISQFPSSNDFEIGFRPWTYYTSDDLDWVLNSGSTPSDSTGPSGAYEGSRYGHLEASGNPNKTAILQATFDFSALGAPQISYAYHMYGADMGSLTLEASTSGGSSWTPLWTMSGDQGDFWYTNTISLSAYAGNAETLLRFRGVTGSNFRSDMALDAITVQDLSNDADGDGLPNEWETLYFGGPTNAVAGANPDNDFYTNLEEYIAGLNPTIADSIGPYYLGSSASNHWFSWTPATGRVYSVYWTSNLLSGFSLLESNLTSGVYTDTVHAAEPQGFYRLGVDLAP